MRLLAGSILVALAAAPALAQPGNPVGPSFSAAAVRADNFDVVFDMKVTLNPTPTIPLLWNQAADARWDVVVCNADKTNKGAVKAEASARWGYLDPGVCTMFANTPKLDLSTVDPDKDWVAKIYLRAHR
ncbi:MAG: hypothetical protein ABMA14_09710 [Hyphomonadaceae bacterium]